jgi:predicted nucleic acid-binding protein
MRIVLDTNILVSGLLSASGPPAWILEALLAGELTLALDAANREEYERVLQRSEFSLPPARVNEVLTAVEQGAFQVVAAPRLGVSLPDPDDEPFLAVAQATGSILVTGNVRHYPARSRGGVEVLTPRQFVDHLRRRG